MDHDSGRTDFIKLLRYGRDKLNEGVGVDRQDAFIYFRDGEPETQRPADDTTFLHLFQSSFESYGEKYWLSTEAYFSLLDYEELQEARASSRDAQTSSKKALRMAIAALVISSVLALTSIVVSFLGLLDICV
tara:strand:- start:161 stop:556 length:396 start_codon:yes stop_codon:yes gene_type:complete